MTLLNCSDFHLLVIVCSRSRSQSHKDAMESEVKLTQSLTEYIDII